MSIDSKGFYAVGLLGCCMVGLCWFPAALGLFIEVPNSKVATTITLTGLVLAIGGFGLGSALEK